MDLSQIDSKTEYALALSSNYRNTMQGLIGSIGSVTSSAGISADLMYKIYDFKAITGPVVKAYYDKMAAAEKEDADSLVKQLEELKKEKQALEEEATASTNSADTSATADEPASAETGSAVSPIYQTQMAEGKGYDYEAVKKYYDDIATFYATHSSYEAYAPVDITA